MRSRHCLRMNGSKAWTKPSVCAQWRRCGNARRRSFSRNAVAVLQAALARRSGPEHIGAGRESARFKLFVRFAGLGFGRRRLLPLRPAATVGRAAPRRRDDDCRFLFRHFSPVDVAALYCAHDWRPSAGEAGLLKRSLPPDIQWPARRSGTHHRPQPSSSVYNQVRCLT
jgi:hypothetical protein